MEALVAAAVADDTAVTCTHQRWTKEGGGAFDVAPIDTSGEAAIIWQVEEWVLGANTVTTQTVNPGDANMHRTSVAHANPTPVKPKKAIVRTEGAGLKITNWFRTNRPGLPWFSTAPEGAAEASSEPSSTTMVQGGRHGSLGAFVAHTELAKKESTAMATKQEGRITKLDEAMVKSAEMIQNMMLAIGSNSQQTKALTGRVGDIGEKEDQIGQKTDHIGQKTDRIIAAVEKAGMAFPPAAPASATAPAAAFAQASGGTKPPAHNAWVTATSGGGRGGGKKRPAHPRFPFLFVGLALPCGTASRALLSLLLSESSLLGDDDTRQRARACFNLGPPRRSLSLC